MNMEEKETCKQVPEISRVMPFYADETLQIFGENLLQAVVYWWQPENGSMPAASAWETPELPDTPPAGAVRLETVTSFAQVLYARSKELRPGCALLWVENEAGLSAPQVVNVPQIWSQSAIRMMAGERLTLYGCNFFSRQDKCFLQASGSARRTDGLQVELTWALSQDYQQNMPHQNEYKSEYLLPDDMPAGEYEIRVHTGTGGVFGWSESIRLTIVESMDLVEFEMNRWRMDIRHARPFSMAGGTVEMIDAALGNGLCDATDVLQGAIDRVAAAGGGASGRHLRHPPYAAPETGRGAARIRDRRDPHPGGIRRHTGAVLASGPIRYPQERRDALGRRLGTAHAAVQQHPAGVDRNPGGHGMPQAGGGYRCGISDPGRQYHRRALPQRLLQRGGIRPYRGIRRV